MNDTPMSNRIHISFFGKRNMGKSSVVNAITGQSLAVVSDVKGTTTDPVLKTMELLPLGPVVIIDTPGIDDEGELGKLRVEKSYQMLNKTDIAVVVCDINEKVTNEDVEIIRKINEKKIPVVLVYNKYDLQLGDNEYDMLTDKKYLSDLSNKYSINIDKFVIVSAKTKYNIELLKDTIAVYGKSKETNKKLVGDLLEPGDFVVLVVPIDSSAPKGRLILPQQQTIRDILESDAIAIVVREYELKDTLKYLGKKPKLVITDSQVFEQVSKDTPDDIYLTSFSILFARYKGNLKECVRGANKIDELQDDDTILISEGCTHHRQCEDIGTVKLPRWIKKYTGKNINIEYTSGIEFKKDLGKYKMIIHCGGCMLNEREMQHRIQSAKDKNISITNYGIAIAHMQGILKRSVEVFSNMWED